MLRCIQRIQTDPYFNLAAEEYLLKTASVDTFMIWRNEPCVVIGKHQNASREINHLFIEENSIPVIRRISGGGAVFHDPGNINFSFIYTNRKENLIDFVEFTRPVIGFLKNSGLDAHFEGKNNIVVNDLKVSGNSAHIFKDKVLYHGTLLFDSDLGMLGQAIKSHEGNYDDKAVRSVRAKVANISGLLAENYSVDEFSGLYRDFIFQNFNDAFEDELHNIEIREIEKLAREKYRSYRWNFGYSPDYKFHEKWNFGNNEFSVFLEVKAGIIQQAEITGPGESLFLLTQFSLALKGCLHEKNAIHEISRLSLSSDKSESHILNQIADHLF
jgi:lipoate-protein ligase A